jgi:hypothetical protein
MHSWRSLVVGLVVPAVAILVVMPLLAHTDVAPLGVPLLFLWIFAWFPLTSLCLWLAWRHDEPRYRDETTRTAGEGR